MDKHQLRLIAVLTAICLVAGAVLAWVNGMTEPQIKLHAEQAKKNALREVFPEAVDFQSDSALLDTVREKVGPEIIDLYLGYEAQGKIAGVSVTVESRGYGGPLQLMVGVSHEGDVTGLKVLKHSETVGLGAKITEESFLHQEAFTTATTQDTLAVTKDRGEVEAITAATISSRAVARGVNQTLAAASVVIDQLTEVSCNNE